MPSACSVTLLPSFLSAWEALTFLPAFPPSVMPPMRDLLGKISCLFLSGSFWVCLCVPSFLKFYDVPFSRSPVFNFHGHSLCTFRLNTYVLQCLEVLKAISLILSPQFNSSSLFGTSSKWWKDFLMSFFPLSYGLYVICIYFLTVSVLFYHSLTNIFHWAVFNFDKI